MKKICSVLLTLALMAVLTLPAVAYTDVPKSSPLAGEVQKATEYGLMNGYSPERFGYTDSMTRAQFVTVLDRMLFQTETDTSTDYITPAMEIPDTIAPAYRTAINHAARYDVVDRMIPFRPSEPITRGEMAEMLVRALGLKSAAQIAEKENSLTFTDITERTGYISVAYDIGMTKGTSAATFSPNATATRAQAAAMLVRIYEKLRQEGDFVHGFYAISSYSQLNLAKGMNAVSAGWSRMVWDGKSALLSTTGAGGNEYHIPTGYQEVTGAANALHLSVFMEGESLKELLASESGRTQAVEQIVNELTVSYNALGKNPYSGVTIDFEGLRSPQKVDFTAFLTDLRAALQPLQKALYVCVSPVLSSGSYYDGYDYAAIGTLADRVILMAYDYGPADMSGYLGTTYYKTAATAPIAQVYWGLKKLCEQVAPDKILLGFSCKNVAWQIDQDGKLLSDTPIYLSNETVAKRLEQSGTAMGWSQEYRQSYAIYETEDGSRYFLWYQDDRSTQSALNAAHLLGVRGVSLWRLGTIPTYDNWNWNSLLP